jgi:hypothetical protein
MGGRNDKGQTFRFSGGIFGRMGALVIGARRLLGLPALARNGIRDYVCSVF